MTAVLGIDVPPELVASWAAWLAPDPQPFLVGPGSAWRDEESERDSVSEELRDTYRLWWGVAADSRVVWLSHERFQSLPRAQRAALVHEQVVRRRGAVPSVRGWSDLLDPAELRAQADGHRFVWWPSLVARDPVAILDRVVSPDRLRSRHADVAEPTWQRCRDILPGARSLAGTFPTGTITHCFGTVMAAAGADDPVVLDSVEPFVDWLATRCQPGGDARLPGTVHVWCGRDGAPAHAAVSIGDGWVLEKPSRDWHSPCAVVSVADVVNRSRCHGRLQRHTIRS